MKKNDAGYWHGDEYYFGMHYDLHAGEGDTELGTRCSLKELTRSLKMLKPDFVQTDCKGHPGWTSWFSETPTASVPPGLKQDALMQWRAATRKLGMPLHCHYSGIWEKAAAKKFPEWAVQRAKDDPNQTPSEKMCPRGPYLEKLMIPQMIELIDRYGVDGFWIDGDIWGVEPCYCDKCTAEYTRRTGKTHYPLTVEDPEWPSWWNFMRESFLEYVRAYTKAVHDHKSGVVVCSNWLHTFTSPGNLDAPTDWISGDNTHLWGIDQSRCEARWLANRGKPWDIMIWSFYCQHGFGTKESPWVFKHAEMLNQEAAVLLSTGGNVQIYETGAGVRTGQLIDWRIKELAQVREFIKQRQPVCQGSTRLPQVAVLHSEKHFYAKPTSDNLMFHMNPSPVKGAVFGLCDAHFGVDILDEYKLLNEVEQFEAVVVPEQMYMSAKMVKRIKEYVQNGGKLLLTGASMAKRFGLDFLGVKSCKIAERMSAHVPVEGIHAPVFSAQWGMLKANSGTKAYAPLGRTALVKERLMDAPSAISKKVGKGVVIYAPYDLFHYYCENRYTSTAKIIRQLMNDLLPSRDIRIDAPTCVDITLRNDKEGRPMIQFLNRGTGIPNTPNCGSVDEIMPVAKPITIAWKLPKKPTGVEWLFEPDTGMNWTWNAKSKTLCVTIPSFHLHAGIRLN